MVNPSRRRHIGLSLAVAAVAGAVAATFLAGVTGATAGPLGPADAPTPPQPSTSFPSVPSLPPMSPLPPGVPGDLTATQVTTSSVTLSWTASAPGCCALDTYTVTYNEAFNDVIWSQNVGDVTSVTITAGIRAASQYRFSVSARDVVGHVSAQTGIALMTPVSNTGDTTPPPGPGNLTAGGAVPGGVPLSWTPPADTSDVAGYNVYGFDGFILSTLLGTTTGTTFTAAPVSGPRPQYYVRARDAAGNLSLASNLVPAAGASPPVSSSPPGTPPTCRVTYTSQSQWADGFVAGITIVNTGPSRIDGWTLTFRFGGDQRITSAWGAVASQSGPAVALDGATWNAVIPPGGSVSLGFQGIWSTGNPAPDAFSVNGTACATD